MAKRHKAKRVIRRKRSLTAKSPNGLLLVVLLILAVCGAVVYLTISKNVAKNPSAASRDMYKWPFSSNSIWNLPIGAGAQYVPSKIQNANAWNGEITTDREEIGVNPSDPIKTVNGVRVHIPPSMSHDGNWNGCSALLTEDNQYVVQGQPLSLSPGGNASWSVGFPSISDWKQDLKGTGFYGCHGGSFLSGIGGSIRKGELSSSEPLRHALKINLHSIRFISRSNNGFRWPATKADSNWNNSGACDYYNGTVPELRMGALLALKPDVNVDSIVTNARVKKIGHALQDYGGYVVDATCWDVHALSVEDGAEFSDGGSFHSDLQKLYTMLHVVNNWDKTTYDRVAASNGAEGSGGGAPRVPWAPDFGQTIPVGSPTPVPSTVPTPSATPPTATSPAPATIIGVFNGDYFDNMDFTGNKVSRQDAKIDFSWALGAPISGIGPDTFSVRWVGTFNFDAAKYRFNATTDDGIRVWVDGSLVIDAWRSQSATTYNAIKTIGAGTHTVKVEYFENGGNATARVNWVKADTCFDMTGDNLVNSADVNVVGAHFNQSGPNLPWDVDNNRNVNVIDLQRVASKNGTTCQ